MFGVQSVKADGGCPFEMPEVKLPEIPSYTVNIKDFGGVGDGGTVNTEAFAKAMKHLDSKGGGKLVNGGFVQGKAREHVRLGINLQGIGLYVKLVADLPGGAAFAVLVDANRL